MGLDMYLDRHTYVQRWDHIPDDRQYAVTVTRGGQPTSIDPARIKYVVEEVAYWRKANAIHGWFVAHVQKGVDDCGTYDVSREHLQDLRAACAEVLADPAAATELLPPQSGFFFGSTALDEWYFKHLRGTITMIDRALACPEGEGHFTYHSSW